MLEQWAIEVQTETERRMADYHNKHKHIIVKFRNLEQEIFVTQTFCRFGHRELTARNFRDFLNNFIKSETLFLSMHLIFMHIRKNKMLAKIKCFTVFAEYTFQIFQSPVMSSCWALLIKYGLSMLLSKQKDVIRQ